MEQPPWALDSKDCELDVGLKPAQRAASLDERAEFPEPILLRNLLDDEQIDEILKEAATAGVWPRGVKQPPTKDDPTTTPLDGCAQTEEEPAVPGSLSDELRQVPHHLAWTDSHVCLYMHMQDHWFVRQLPASWARIRGGMESRPWMEGAIPVLAEDFIGNEQSMMHVRTIELHHYAAGGGLLDPGHRDCGSDLTISVLLSDPDDVSGGDFVTFCGEDSEPVAHKMRKGDAILFESEKLHNISTVTAGVRQSLVVELWPSKRY